MRQKRQARGFSLVELLIALAVSLLVIAGAMALLVSQQRIFQVSSADRALQETGRIALEELTSNLRLAGYGIDPSYAFDFGELANARQDRAPANANVSAASTFANCKSITCRDSIATSDEVVFRYRNPSFVRTLAAAPTSGNSITIAGPLLAPLYQGQILQVMCFAGDMRWAYVTVGATVQTTDAATVVINLAGANGDQFPFQNGYLTDSCYSAVAPRDALQAAPTTYAAAAKVYKVDQFRYYVARYDGAGTIVTDITSTARPFLMLDQGLVNGDPILNVVAPDVEDIQFAYVFPRSQPANQLIGATASTPISADGSGIDVDPDEGPPAFSDETADLRRLTQHPGNIRAVVVSVVARSPAADLQVFDSAIPAAGNRPTVTGPVGYRRQIFETTAATRNLDARAPFFPTYSTNGGADQLNLGGG